MNKRAPSFDRLAVWYEGVERLAFGADLERARFCHAGHLRGCERVLILGEGDGRFLSCILQQFPEVRIDCVDASAGMLAKAQSRLGSEDRARVNFRQADALTADLGENCYDAVVTLFFLDCFSEGDAQAIVSKVTLALREKALWLWADFSVPAFGWRRWRANLWLRVLYAFFAWETGLAVRQLPPSEAMLNDAGFRLVAQRSFQAGLVQSAVFAKVALSD